MAWPTMSPLLADNGYCVYAMPYGLDPVTGQLLVGDRHGGRTPW